MRGTLLKVAVWLVESPLGGIIAAKAMRDSGIPQVGPGADAGETEESCGAADGGPAVCCIVSP